MNPSPDLCLAPRPCCAQPAQAVPRTIAHSARLTRMAAAKGMAAAPTLAAAAEETDTEPAGWPDGLLDRCFQAWAQRAEARWVQEPSPIPHRYY